MKLKRKPIFSDTFDNIFNRKKITESVLDFPNGQTLPEKVWCKSNTVPSTYIMTQDAKAILMHIAQLVKSKFNLPETTEIHVIGSLCSNLYTDDSDIDLHFIVDSSYDDSEIKTLNKELRKLVNEVIPEENRKVFGHPVEVYLQTNRYQDLMSVGCYDLTKDIWLSGPEIYPEDYNPYEKYFSSALAHVSNTIDAVRSKMLACGECAMLILKISKVSSNIPVSIISKFAEELNAAVSLFGDLREARTIISAPTNEREAIVKRNSQEWKVSDASFKLIGQFGYTGILKTLGDIKIEIENSNDFNIISMANKIVSSIKQKLFEDF